MLSTYNSPSPIDLTTVGLVHGFVHSSAGTPASAASYTITGGAWASGIGTLTIGPHPFLIGQPINVVGAPVSGYNTSGAYVVAVTAATVSYQLAADPGGVFFTTGGFVQPGTKDDQLIQLCITSASHTFLLMTGKGPADGSVPLTSPYVTPVSFDEWYDGKGGVRMYLRNPPIQTVQELWIDNRELTQSKSMGTAGFVIDGGGKSLSIRRGGSGSFPLAWPSANFSRGIQNVNVKYTGGFTMTPPDIVKAVTHLVSINYKRTEWLDMASKTLSAQGASGTTAYRAWTMPPEVAIVVNHYARKVPLG